MPLVKKDLTPTVWDKDKTEEEVESFVLSKVEEKLAKRYPPHDVHSEEPQAKLVIVKRTLDDVQRRLATRRIEAKTTREKLDKQWKDLADKEELLKQSFITFNKFVKENQDKRLRAEKKLEANHELVEREDAKIQMYQYEYDKMLQVRTQMESALHKYKFYEDYLQHTWKYSGRFKSIDDLFNRYEALSESRKFLLKKQDEDLATLENARHGMLLLRKAMDLKVMGMHNKVAGLIERYDKAHYAAIKWQYFLGDIQAEMQQRDKEINQVREATWNLFCLMCKRRSITPEFGKSDVENQLIFIKQSLLEMNTIQLIVRKEIDKLVNV